MKRDNSTFKIQHSKLITQIPCVILSGGRSSRMGEDKSLLPFDSTPTIIEYQYNRLSKIFSDVYISSKTDKFNNKIDTSKLILDNSDIYSPMIALKSILSTFTDKVFIVAVDTPFVSFEAIETIIKNSNSNEITIASSDDKIHNLCGIFSCSLLDKIDGYLKEDMHKINYLVRNSDAKIIDFKDSKQFLNVNTQDDYKVALKQI